MLDPSLVVGLDEIDEHHGRVLQAVVDILEAAKAGDANTKVMEIVGFLEREAHAHFEHEEALMAKTSYPDLEHHRAEHAGFVANELASLKRTVALGGASFTLTLETAHVLRAWIRQHIMRTDAKLANWLKSNQK